MIEKNDFFEKVYEVTKKIPYGRVTTYGAIAKFLGTANSAIVVGWALNNSRFLNTFIPAHRVVNRKGILSGKNYFGGSSVMKQLLENEKIKVENDKVVEFEKLFWDPQKEL